MLGLIALAGCGDGRPKVVPVSGQVLIDGKPLEYGSIRVSPEGARAATGQLGPEGRFTLQTFEDQDGVVPGNHPVAVAAGEYLSETDTYWHAPEKYSRASTSNKTVTIDGPTDSLIVELTWDGDKPYTTRNGVRVR